MTKLAAFLSLAVIAVFFGLMLGSTVTTGSADVDAGSSAAAPVGGGLPLLDTHWG